MMRMLLLLLVVLNVVIFPNSLLAKTTSIKGHIFVGGEIGQRQYYAVLNSEKTSTNISVSNKKIYPKKWQRYTYTIHHPSPAAVYNLAYTVANKQPQAYTCQYSIKLNQHGDDIETITPSTIGDEIHKSDCTLGSDSNNEISIFITFPA